MGRNPPGFIITSPRLIQIVETRQNRGTVEKYYQAVANKFRVDRSLLDFAPESEAAISEAQALIINVLDETLTQIQEKDAQDFLKTPDARDSLVLMRAQGLRLSQAQITDLRSKIEGWLKECCDEETGHDDDPSHALTLVLYPVFDKEPNPSTSH